MIFRKIFMDPRVWGSYVVRTICSNHIDENLNYLLCKSLNISESKAKFLQLKYPVIKNLSSERINNLFDVIYELGFQKDILLKEPNIWGILPVTIKFRYTVLKECGIENITTQNLLSYMTLVKQKTIGDLKDSKIIPAIVNVENRLASYMTQWPTSLTTLVYGDVNKYTLYTLRLKIIQRYLELILDLSQDEFNRGLQTYPTIKHRPLQAINKTLNILQSQILMPNEKIKSNLYLIHANPENLQNILFHFKTIGGIDIREIIRMYPKLVLMNCFILQEIKKVLEEYKITNEAQRKCFQIYTLSPSTIKKRIEKAKNTPEFKMFYNHPRFLKMIYYNTKASKRLMELYNKDKKCLSLNVLSGSSAHFEVYEKAPGDRLGKGKDLLFCISQSLGNVYNMNQISKVVKRHPFWQYIPLVQIKHVHEQLSTEFSASDIFENCTILLYPWNKIRHIINLLKKKHNGNKISILHEQINLKSISKSQTLSLILYLLERNHYFSGNGVWSEEKQKYVDVIGKGQESKTCKLAQ